MHLSPSSGHAVAHYAIISEHRTYLVQDSIQMCHELVGSLTRGGTDDIRSPVSRPGPHLAGVDSSRLVKTYSRFLAVGVMKRSPLPAPSFAAIFEWQATKVGFDSIIIILGRFYAKAYRGCRLSHGQGSQQVEEVWQSSHVISVFRGHARGLGLEESPDCSSLLFLSNY